MNIEQNEEKSQTQGKFVSVRTEIKDVNRYVMCPTDKKVTMQATLRANQYSGQQISEPGGPSIKIDKMWDCLMKMLKVQTIRGRSLNQPKAYFSLFFK